MIAATAPPAAALLAFCSKVQVPRIIRATWPLAEPAGSGEEHSSPVASTVVTSNTVVVIGPGTGPLLEKAWMGAAPAMDRLPLNARLLCTAPTLITEA